AHVADQRRRERVVGGIAVDDVEAEVVAVQAAAVRELDLEVEAGALFSGHRRLRGGWPNVVRGACARAGCGSSRGCRSRARTNTSAACRAGMCPLTTSRSPDSGGCARGVATRTARLRWRPVS